jgi:beta-aspartyl-peptidase (threonine type)
MRLKCNCFPLAGIDLFRFFVLCLMVGVSMPNRSWSQDQPANNRWSIAIHGGAGGNPAKWDDAKRRARTEGLERALTTGRDLLSRGGESLDVVEAVIRVLEDDANFNAGRGAVVTEGGQVELDASIMDGKTAGCGAVAAVTTVKNPIALARLVMTKTKHVLLTGEGANAFAAAQQVPLATPDYFLSRHRQSINADVTPGIGTVGCVVLDSHGNLAAGTSTGGTSKKMLGRVGDSPIVGAGTFAANDACAVSCTGIGEEYIRHAVAYDIVAQMRYADRSLTTAVTKIMTERLKPGDGGLIAVSHDGQIVMQHNTPGMSCGAADSTGRFETHLELDNGGRDATPPASQQPEHVITQLIRQQAHDWNAGDLDAFMNVYWRSDQLTFSSGGNVTRGWDATLARYKQRYPDAKTMGNVTFTQLEFLRLDEDAMQVLGAWDLQRAEQPIGGRFTLIFKRFGEAWRIVHDHTSVSEAD